MKIVEAAGLSIISVMVFNATPAGWFADYDEPVRLERGRRIEREEEGNNRKEKEGEKENIESCEHCITRLRLILKDAKIVDEDAVMNCGASGIVRPAKNACQIVIGTKVQFVYDEFEKLIDDEDEE